MARVINSDAVMSQIVRIRGSIIDLENARHMHANTFAAARRKLIANVDGLEDMLAPTIVDGGSAVAPPREYVEMLAKANGLQVIDCEEACP